MCGDYPADQPLERTSPQAVSRRRAVLVVEDNRDSAQILAVLLQASGHQVRVAHDGNAAIRAVKDFAPDVVLLDIGLPGLDGYGVARELRSMPALDRALLVAVTGYGQPEDRRLALEAGFDEHLVKPVTPEALEQVLLLGRPSGGQPAAPGTSAS